MLDENSPLWQHAKEWYEKTTGKKCPDDIDSPEFEEIYQKWVEFAFVDFKD